MSNFVGATINTADLASKLTGFAISFLEGTFCEGFCEVLDLGKDMIFEAIRTGKINHETAKALESMDGELLDDLKQFLGQELKKYAKKDKIPTKLKGKDLTEIFSSRLDTVAEMVEKYADQHNLSEQRRLALAYVLGEVKRAAVQAAHKTMGGDDKRMVLVLSEIMESMYSNTKDEIVALLTHTVYIRPTECYNCGNDELHYDDRKQMACCSHCGRKTAYVINTGLMSGVQRNLDEFRAKVEQNQQEILAGLNALSQKMDEHDKRNSDAHTALHEDHETMRREILEIKALLSGVALHNEGEFQRPKQLWSQTQFDESIALECLELGLICDIAEDYSEAAKYYELAAVKGLAEAQYYLGDCYRYGHGVEVNEVLAVQWFERATQQGFAKAQCALGDCYRIGCGVKQNYKKAVGLFQLAAAQGVTEANFYLGVFYENGWGVSPNVTEAVRYYRLAAEQGLAEAQHNLGNCYHYGKGVKQNYEESLKWSRLAAEQGFADAQYNLGVCYMKGIGVRQDYTEAARLFRLAAEQGYADAQYNLGVCYTQGAGVRQDYTEAVKWYKLAADQGHESAQIELVIAMVLAEE